MTGDGVTTGPRVLLIEDVDPVRDLSWHALGRARFTVETAGTAGECLALLAERRYAAIVANASLSEFPPLDWLAALRGAAPSTPLICYVDPLCAWGLEAVSREFRPATVLAIPFAPEDLVAAVREALGGR